MSNHGLERVQYQDEQVLGVEDFIGEQAFHLKQRQRHNQKFHQWGILQGLEMVLVKEGLLLTPGYAIDPKGRDIIVTEPKLIVSKLTLDETLRFQDQSETKMLAIWLRYGEKTTHDRIQEGSNIYYTARTTPIIDGRAYREYLVARGDKGNDILLGQVFLIDTAGKSATQQSSDYEIDTRARPLAGIYAAEVKSPEHGALISLNDGDTDTKDHTISFSFYCETEPEAETRKTSENCGQEGPKPNETPCENAREPAPAPTAYYDPVLELRRDGFNRLKGGLSVTGSISTCGGIYFDKPDCTDTKTPKPWQIYRVKDAISGDEELRIELTEGCSSAFVIGSPEEDGQSFAPILTVSSDGNVAIKGDLLVEGRINPGPPSPDGSPDRKGSILPASSVDRGQKANTPKKPGFFNRWKIALSFLLSKIPVIGRFLKVKELS